MSKYVKDNEWGTKYPHFKKEEFKCPCCGKYGNGIASTLLIVLERLRKKYGPIKVVSGYRCKSWNKKAGGVSNSLHMYGQACDFYFTSGILKNQNTRINIVREIRKMQYVHYAYCNVNGDYPNMGDEIHVDTYLVDPDETKGNVADLQRWLNKTYDYNLAVDNKYGKNTKKHCIMALQHELNVQFKTHLVEDGIFGVATKKTCPNVTIGSEGNITRLIQHLLLVKGYYIGNAGADGIYGKATSDAIKKFQKFKGLVSDGICGANTFEKLFE